MSKFFLKGAGEVSEAIFVPLGAKVYVVAEVGMTGCYDDVLPIEKAREIYADLRKRGWKRVAKLSRTAQEISRSING